jgi:hypothetical protein
MPLKNRVAFNGLLLYRLMFLKRLCKHVNAGEGTGQSDNARKRQILRLSHQGWLAFAITADLLSQSLKMSIVRSDALGQSSRDGDEGNLGVGMRLNTGPG